VIPIQRNDSLSAFPKLVLKKSSEILLKNPLQFPPLGGKHFGTLFCFEDTEESFPGEEEVFPIDEIFLTTVPRSGIFLANCRTCFQMKKVIK